MKRGQMELAIVKGLIIALAVIGGFFIYETIQATTPDGNNIECKWDCSNAVWGTCINGYSIRDTSFCTIDNEACRVSEPKPDTKKKCD